LISLLLSTAADFVIDRIRKDRNINEVIITSQQKNFLVKQYK